jgi:hypothetical protein
MKFGILLITLMLAASTGCQHSLVPISDRSLEGEQKLGSQNALGNARPIGKPESQPQLYIKQPNLKVSEAEQNLTGSLFDADDKRNFLIVPSEHLALGSFIDVLVVYARAPEDLTKTDPPNSPAAEGSNQPAGLSDAEKKILAGLPNLQPAEAKIVPIRQFKMQVVGRRKNGDYELKYERQETSDEQSYALLVHAILPHESVISSDPRTTAQLTEIDWIEVRDGRSQNRSSPGWDDEYSLRMSGFSELKSREAIALEDKRKQLEQSRKLIEDQLQQISKERNNVAQTRAEVAKEKQSTDEVVSGLKKEIETRDKTIADQRDELENLKGESKPGAQKDASGGK